MAKTLIQTMLFQQHHIDASKPLEISFLDLPGEVRNLVYSFVAADIDEEAIISVIPRKYNSGVWTKLQRRVKRRAARPSCFPLLLTCRQVHREASSIIRDITHARFISRGSRFWQLKRLLLQDLRFDIDRTISAVGPGLVNVKHLHLVDLSALHLLTMWPDALDDDLRSSDVLLVRRAVRLKDSVLELRRQMPNISRIVLSSNDHVYKTTWQKLWALACYGPDGEVEKKIKDAFPKLSSLTFEFKEGLVVEYQVNGEGKWHSKQEYFVLDDGVCRR